MNLPSSFITWKPHRLFSHPTVSLLSFPRATFRKPWAVKCVPLHLRTMATEPQIKTRILIVSDTHTRRPAEKKTGTDTDDEFEQQEITRVPTGFRDPLPEADVMLHCGDLTRRGMSAEIKETFDWIRSVRAPLKLVIAGNHDLVLDPVYWDKYEQYRGPQPEAPREAWGAIKDAEADGVRFLDEGTHAFDLQNGARLTVYASPWTPQYGSWAFQYRGAHDFNIPPGVDIAMTHGPPRGVLDEAGFVGERAGCEWLFSSVRRARPKIHCFGHIHEAWGAYLAKWRGDGSEGLHDSFSETVDAENSGMIKDVKQLKIPFQDHGNVGREKIEALLKVSKQRGVNVDTTDGESRLEEGNQTLFVNASIMDIRYRPVNCPWLIDVNLPTAGKDNEA